MFTVIYDEAALQYLGRLETKVKKRVIEKISSTKENPHRYFKRLVGRQEYRLRVGDYRVIADIDDRMQRISILFVGPRENVYEKQ